MCNNKELFVLMNMYCLFYIIKFLKTYKGRGKIHFSVLRTADRCGEQLRDLDTVISNVKTVYSIELRKEKDRFPPARDDIWGSREKYKKQMQKM